ncbi:MAG TPA: peptide transporter, partial [Erwinia sp.]|nr:peptide transporter [Erwinia sp.]
MFKSFFPRPALFFTSAALWCAIAIIGWFSGLSHLASLANAGPLPNNALRFIAPSALAFYLYYFAAFALFAGFWRLFSPHPWQRWSVNGSALIIFVTWFSVQMNVAINAWYER